MPASLECKNGSKTDPPGVWQRRRPLPHTQGLQTRRFGPLGRRRLSACRAPPRCSGVGAPVTCPSAPASPPRCAIGCQIPAHPSDRHVDRCPARAPRPSPARSQRTATSCVRTPLTAPDHRASSSAPRPTPPLPPLGLSLSRIPRFPPSPHPALHPLSPRHHSWALPPTLVPQRWRRPATQLPPALASLARWATSTRGRPSPSPRPQTAAPRRRRGRQPPHPPRRKIRWRPWRWPVPRRSSPSSSRRWRARPTWPPRRPGRPTAGGRPRRPFTRR